MLHAPNQGREKDGGGRIVELKTLAMNSIVGDHLATAMDTDEKLGKPEVGMQTANFLTWDRGHQKEPLHFEGNVVAGFGNTEQAAIVLELRQTVKFDPGNAAGGGLRFHGHNL